MTTNSGSLRHIYWQQSGQIYPTLGHLHQHQYLIVVQNSVFQKPDKEFWRLKIQTVVFE